MPPKDMKCKKTVDTSGNQVVDENAVDVLTGSNKDEANFGICPGAGLAGPGAKREGGMRPACKPGPVASAICGRHSFTM